MIPQERMAAVVRGLEQAFGVGTMDEIEQIHAGNTASLVYRVVVRGEAYLLKIITRQEDPTRHYASMRLAASEGLAPPVVYTNIEDRVSMTGFVKAVPMAVEEGLARLPGVLRRLHALPPFGRAPFNTTCTFLLQREGLTIGPARDAYLRRFRDANLLSEREYAVFFERLAELTAVYPWEDSEMVSCHNDLFKPDNILFDGANVVLVDWEAAFLNDRYADLAVVANQLVGDDRQERAFLAGYFGAEPTEYQSTRLFLMQQLTHLFYAMGFLMMGSALPERPADIPDYAAYQRRLWSGGFDFSDKHDKYISGMVHWQRFLSNVESARYGESTRQMR